MSIHYPFPDFQAPDPVSHLPVSPSRTSHVSVVLYPALYLYISPPSSVLSCPGLVSVVMNEQPRLRGEYWSQGLVLRELEYQIG